MRTQIQYQCLLVALLLTSPLAAQRDTIRRPLARPELPIHVLRDTRLLLPTGTAFNGTFYGSLDGRKATLAFRTLNALEQYSEIEVTLTDQARQVAMKGVVQVRNKAAEIPFIILKSANGQVKKLLEQVSLFGTSPKLITAVTGDGYGACFSSFSNDEFFYPTIRPDMIPKFRFRSEADFIGVFSGYVGDTRAELKIDTVNGWFVIRLSLAGSSYGTYLKKLPVSATQKHVLQNIRLRTPDYGKEVLIEDLYLHTWNNHINTGFLQMEGKRLPFCLSGMVRIVPHIAYFGHFPCPMPNWTDKLIVTNILPGCNTLGEVDSRLRALLDAGTYGLRGYNYFKLPNGFAVATPLEKVTAQGAPDGANRWSFPQQRNILPTFVSWIADQLTFVEPSFYRMFVFTVSDGSCAIPAGMENSDVWKRAGAPVLPEEIAQRAKSPGTQLTAHLYFYEKAYGRSELTLIAPDSGRPDVVWQIREHLSNTGIRW